MRALLLLALLATRVHAVECTAPNVCIPACDDARTIQLPGPPDGNGYRINRDNDCQWHKPINYTIAEKITRQGCFDARCKLGLAPTRIIGGGPHPLTDCVVCTSVTGGDTCTIGFFPCEID